ncbi:MAG: VacJ family lipoprotein [Pseudomonadota bacterium]|nr:VacJ family lipoprotein [Pseudomonadota bacterium]
MRNLKNFTVILPIVALTFFASPNAKTAEECFEGASRAIFKFNMALDNIILEPLAKGYNKLPSPIRAGTSNFTSNLATLMSIPNNILQGNLKQLGHSVGSFTVNTTVGVLGFLNPAEKIGLKPHKEDVGQTLGSYGIGPGCYFVLPILGPTTARDSIGLIADTFVDPFAHITIRENEILGASGNSLDYYSVKGASAVDFRADNDKTFESLEKNSIDLYSSLKSIYLQDRENKVKNSFDDQDEWGNLDK